jgi:hypothetical protein
MVMLDKARRIIQAGINCSTTMEGRNRLEAVTFCTDGNDDLVVALGNWTAITVSPITAVPCLDSRFTQVVDDSPQRVADLLEQLGVQLEWANGTTKLRLHMPADGNIES